LEVDDWFGEVGRVEIRRKVEVVVGGHGGSLGKSEGVGVRKKMDLAKILGRSRLYSGDAHCSDLKEVREDTLCIQ
jgi:hypothetical protein